MSDECLRATVLRKRQETSCPALGNKLGSLFGRQLRRWNSDPPDLTGRKRVYCGRCGEKWIMVDPDDLQWTVHQKFGWFCETCSRIRTKEKYANDITVPCSTCRKARLRIHPDEVEYYVNEGWVCGDCVRLGVCTEK